MAGTTPGRGGRTVGWWVVAVVSALAVVVPQPASSAQDLDEVVEERVELEGQVARALTRLEELEGTRAAIEGQLDGLERRREELRAELRTTQQDLSARVRAHYKGVRPTVLSTLFSDGQGADPLEGHALLAMLHRRDDAAIQAARAVQVQLAQTEVLLGERRGALVEVEDELQARTAALQAELDAVTRREQALRSRRERQQYVERGPQRGVYSCIFDQGVHHFIDSWGFPRSGGRRHRGTDVMAPRGVNTYAFTAGTIGRITNGRLGGLALRIHGDDGNRYYYAHLDGIADGIAPGVRVEAGQLVAFNGDTGNARGGPTHVHFELAPGGGRPINPYAWLRAVCDG